MKTEQEYYKIARSVWKGAKMLMGFYGVTVAADLPEGLDAFMQDWPVIVGAIVLALVTAGWNAWKHRGVAGNPNPFDKIPKRRVAT